MRRAAVAIIAITLGLALPALKASAQDKPVLVVNLVTLAKDTPWQYSLPALQQRTIAAMQKKFGDKVTVADKAPAGATRVYTLDGVITKHYTDSDVNMTAGSSVVYNEHVEVHYTLSDAGGKILLDKKDTFTTNTDPHAATDNFNSPGPLAGQMVGSFVGRVDNTKFYN